MDSILGTLDAFFETGTEGIVWSVTNNDLEGWNKLNCLKDGDYLTIFDSVDKTTVVWEGVIQYEYERNLTPSPFNPNYKKQAVFNSWVNGLQYNVDPETWTTWFFQELPAMLVKKNT